MQIIVGKDRSHNFHEAGVYADSILTSGELVAREVLDKDHILPNVHTVTGLVVGQNIILEPAVPAGFIYEVILYAVLITAGTSNLINYTIQDGIILGLNSIQNPVINVIYPCPNILWLRAGGQLRTRIDVTVAPVTANIYYEYLAHPDG